MSVSISKNHGMIQFEGTNGQTITTSLVGLTISKSRKGYHAYFGKGFAGLSYEELKSINEALGLAVPDPIDDKDDDDDDFTTP